METLETEKRLYERINECIKKNVKRKRETIANSKYDGR